MTDSSREKSDADETPDPTVADRKRLDPAERRRLLGSSLAPLDASRRERARVAAEEARSKWPKP